MLFNAFLLLLAAARHAVNAQFDPIANLCRRLDHQSTIINGMLYVDGGREVFVTYNENFTQISPRTLGNNQFLISVNVSQSWDWKSNFPQSKIAKLQDSTGKLSVPDWSRGALYPDSSNPYKFWLFGGTTAQDNITFIGWELPQPGANSLWSYDSQNNTWTAYDMSKYNIQKPASGATTSVPGKGLAFWFNGMQDNGSSVETAVIADTSRFLTGMVVLDLNNQAARNLSTAAVSEKARVRGSMVHVPLLGSDGIIVLMGGGEKPTSDLTHNWKGDLVSFSTVHIFDVASLNNASAPNGVWYKQQTSGITPSPRIDACLVLGTAPDNSSYNLYLYGGRDGASTYYDEVWVLSLPSFQWIQVYKGYSPRYSHTCHVIGQRQLITVGGSDTSNITSGCDWHTAGVGVMDLSSITWGSTYRVDAAPYAVPTSVVTVVGGTINGGASIGAPVAGFASPALKALFYPPSMNGTNSSAGNNTPSSTSSTSTPSPSPTSAKKATSVGAIAGGVIAGLAVIAAILGLALLFLRRERRKKEAKAMLDGGNSNPAILDSNPLYEANGASAPVYEKYADNLVVSELPDSRDRNNSASGEYVTHDAPPVELPAGNSQR